MPEVEILFKKSTNKVEVSIEVMSGLGVEDYELIKLRFITTNNYLTPDELCDLGNHLIETSKKITLDYNSIGKPKKIRK